MPAKEAPGPASVRFTYLHGDVNLMDTHDSDSDAATPAAQVAAAVPPGLQARIDTWNARMGEAFDHARHGEGRPPEDWPAPWGESLTEEYDSLLAELRELGFPVVRDAWWAPETDEPSSQN